MSNDNKLLFIMLWLEAAFTAVSVFIGRPAQMSMCALLVARNCALLSGFYCLLFFTLFCAVG